MAKKGINCMKVFVALLNEGTEVWRPVDAEHLGGDLYRLLGLVPDDESWQFQPGDTVHCAAKVFREGNALVAIRASTR
jgi:hypothetical protein